MDDYFQRDYRFPRRSRLRARLGLAAALMAVGLVAVMVIWALSGCAAQGLTNEQKTALVAAVSAELESRELDVSQTAGGDAVTMIEEGLPGEDLSAVLGWVALIVAIVSYPAMRTARRVLWRMTEGRDR